MLHVNRIPTFILHILPIPTFILHIHHIDHIPHIVILDYKAKKNPPEAG